MDRHLQGCDHRNYRFDMVSGAGVLAVLLLFGCVEPPASLDMVRDTEQDDIPVPRHFEFQHSEAFDVPTIEAGKFRHWTGYYQGPGKYASLVPWYITEMRKQGWTFKGMSGPAEAKKLSFEKGEEESSVEIRRELEPMVGGFINVVCAKIRQRGNEDYTVDEILGLAKGPGLLPTSYTASQAGREAPEQKSSAAEEKKEGRAENETAAPQAGRDASVLGEPGERTLREIEEFESSH